MKYFDREKVVDIGYDVDVSKKSHQLMYRFMNYNNLIEKCNSDIKRFQEEQLSEMQIIFGTDTFFLKRIENRKRTLEKLKKSQKEIAKRIKELI